MHGRPFRASLTLMTYPITVVYEDPKPNIIEMHVPTTFFSCPEPLYAVAMIEAHLSE